MKKYKIVVLTDLNTSAKTTIKSAISLAKMISGDIEIFHVKKPTDIIDKENQLSAMRTINNQYTKTYKKMQNLINPIAIDYGMNIKHSLTFGNTKNEIKNLIEERQPDIIVLGKRKSAPFNFIGDGITQYVFNTFKGVIMIATDKNGLEPNKEISLGMLNNSETSVDFKFAEDLMANIQKPLKSFKIVKNSREAEEITKPANQKMVEYVFEQNDGSMKNLSNYLAKNNIDLLSLNRMKKNADNKMNLMKSDIKSLVENLNVTLLVTAE